MPETTVTGILDAATIGGGASCVPEATGVRRGSRWTAAVPAVLALVTFLTFLPALDNGFVDWDDEILFTKNPHYRGLGWVHVRWMFSNITMGHYVPITWLTLGADYVLWGMDPAGYHLTNLVVHAATSALFYLLAVRLLGAATSYAGVPLRLAAAVSALFFGIHPLRVESVAWATERRDVLSGFFFFATLLLYLRAREQPETAARRWHLAAAISYLLGILSKSMVMTLPVVLVLLEVYPFRRLGGRARGWLRSDVWRAQVPYVALGILAAMLAVYAQAANQFFTSTEQLGWTTRPALVAYSLAFYVTKTVFPLGLSPLYELPPVVHPLAPRFLAAAIGTAVSAALLFRLRRAWPAGLAVGVSYVVLIAPVAGLVHSGYQLAHDRYSYLSCAGWALLVGAAAGWLWQTAVHRRLNPVVAGAAVAAIGGWLVVLGVLTWHQVQVWRDTNTLWQYALDAEPDCTVCLYNQGAMLYNAGFPALAKERFERIMALRPDRARARGNLGLAYVSLGNLAQAAAEYQAVLARLPDDVEAHNNLGVIWRSLGRAGDAAREFEWALRLEDNPVFRANLALALLDLARPQEALTQAAHAVAHKPDLAQARFALALAHRDTGNLVAARQHYEILRALDAAVAATLGPALVTEW